MVIFAGGKFSRKCCQDLSCGGNFRDTSHISLSKPYGFYFCMGEIFAKKTISEKWENYPHATISMFTVCSAINTVETVIYDPSRDLNEKVAYDRVSLNTVSIQQPRSDFLTFSKSKKITRCT